MKNPLEKFKSHEKKIDGVTVSVNPWPARHAFAMKIKLLRLLGPSLGELIGTVVDGKSDGKKAFDILSSDVDFERIGSTIRNLMDVLDEDTFMNLVDKILDSTRVDGKEISDEETFNAIFTGSLELVYKILWFVLEVNFGSFFGKSGIGSLIKKK